MTKDEITTAAKRALEIVERRTKVGDFDTNAPDIRVLSVLVSQILVHLQNFADPPQTKKKLQKKKK